MCINLGIYLKNITKIHLFLLTKQDLKKKKKYFVDFCEKNLNINALFNNDYYL